MNRLRIRSLAAALLLGAALPSLGFAQTNGHLDRRMKIDNQTDQSVFEMHISNVGTHRWGPDQLGYDGVILPHHYMPWNIDDGSGYCRFDFKFIMKDGTEKYAWDVNVCQESEVDVTDDGTDDN